MELTSMPDTERNLTRSFDKLWKELAGYYHVYDKTKDKLTLLFDDRVDKAIRERMDAEVEAHPEWTSFQIKSRMHEVIAEMAEPVIFRQTPFPFECKCRPQTSWGVASVGNWMRYKYTDRYFAEVPRENYLKYRDLGFGFPFYPVDDDHYNLGYDVILQKGLLGLIEDAKKSLAEHTDEHQRDFLNSVIRSLNALLHLIERFADATETAAKNESDPLLATQLKRSADAMRYVPANPARNFFEALLTLSACRELFATFDGVGISIIGHLDRHLTSYYLADLANGTLTEEEAADLLMRNMVLTDARFDIHNNPFPETSSTMELGGCDEKGVPIYTPLTKLILQVHCDLKLINPKPQCRISSKSDPAYIQQLAEIIASGHNTLAVYNDDVLIPAQQKMGKKLEDCRLYVNGGCQEHMLLGTEPTAGAYWWYNLPRIIDFTLHPDVKEQDPTLPINPVVEPKSFDDIYDIYFANHRAILVDITSSVSQQAKAWPEVNPCPLISSTMADCLENAKDLTEGGTRYGPSSVWILGFATLVDSLNAIRLAVFERKLCSYQELMNALRANWEGYEELRGMLTKLPHFGQDDKETDEFAGRVARDVASGFKGLTNERGGPFQPAFFSWYCFADFGTIVKATPDGRASGEPLSRGAGPSNIARVPTIAHFISSMSKVDFSDYPAIAVIDAQLPLASNYEVTVNAFSSMLKAFVMQGGPMLQCSVVNPEILKAAQDHPEQHSGLVVRVCGFSAYFVALGKGVQDEIIDRTLLRMN